MEWRWSRGCRDELVAPSYRIEHDPGDPWEGKVLNLDTFKKRVVHSRAVFPDQSFHIKSLLEDNGQVAVSWFFNGTHKGDLPGLPGTNNPVNVSGLTIYYFDIDGKITGHWQIIDRLGFLKQIGLWAGNSPNFCLAGSISLWRTGLEIVSSLHIIHFKARERFDVVFWCFYRGLKNDFYECFWVYDWHTKCFPERSYFNNQIFLRNGHLFTKVSSLNISAQ